MFDLFTAISHVERAADTLTQACFHHSIAADAATAKHPTADILQRGFKVPSFDPTDMLETLGEIK